MNKQTDLEKIINELFEGTVVDGETQKQIAFMCYLVVFQTQMSVLLEQKLNSADFLNRVNGLIETELQSMNESERDFYQKTTNLASKERIKDVLVAVLDQMDQVTKDAVILRLDKITV